MLRPPTTMENIKTETGKYLKTSFLFALGFVCFAIVSFVWRSDSINNFWKVLAIAIFAVLTLATFKKENLTKFAGFCFLMIGLNYVLSDTSIEFYWKMAASLIVLAQLGTIGKEIVKDSKEAINSETSGHS